MKTHTIIKLKNGLKSDFYSKSILTNQNLVKILQFYSVRLICIQISDHFNTDGWLHFISTLVGYLMPNPFYEYI